MIHGISSVGVRCKDFVGQRFLNDKSLVFTRDSYGVGSYNHRCYKHGGCSAACIASSNGMFPDA